MKEGDKVHTIKTKFEKPKNGMIKRIDRLRNTPPLIYVVFDCDGDWDNYRNYTAILTPNNMLRQEWIEETIPHPINDIL